MDAAVTSMHCTSVRRKSSEVLDHDGVVNTITIYRGTHPSAVRDRFQNFVVPFFSKSLCFTAVCH